MSRSLGSSDIPLDDRLIHTSFLSHHAVYCCLDPQTCPELGLNGLKGGQRLIGSALSQGLDLSRLKLVTDAGAGPVLSFEAHCAIAWMFRAIRQDKSLTYGGPLAPGVAEADRVAQVVFGGLAAGAYPVLEDQAAVQALSHLFASQEDLLTALADVVHTVGGIPRAAVPSINP